MPDRFQPLPWNDGPQGGTPITSARGPRRWEGALDEVDNDLATVEDDVASIKALLSQGGGAPSGDLIGSTANRPTPTLGRRYFDTDLMQPLWGTGTGWLAGTVTALTGTGNTNAPVMQDAEVQAGGTIGQIVLTWNAVAGATHYKLYEDGSLTGVAGAGSLTTTTTTRTPGTARTYHYWVTAFVGGVESAISNKAEAVLPFVADGGGGGTPVGTPATILDIGPGAGQNHFDVGVGYSTGHVNHTQSEIINGYSEIPYFYARESAVATGIQVVQFQVFANGAATTPNTEQGRSELREYAFDPGGSLIIKSAWLAAAGGGVHTMIGKSRITHLPSGGTKPWVCFAQIHGGTGDMCRLQVEAPSGDGTHNNLYLRARTHQTAGGSETSTTIQSTYSVGDEIDWKIEVVNGTAKVYIGGVVKWTWAINQSGCYFKAGSYNQFNTSTKGGYAASEYASVELRALDVTHTS